MSEGKCKAQTAQIETGCCIMTMCLHILRLLETYCEKQYDYCPPPVLANYEFYLLPKIPLEIVAF